MFSRMVPWEEVDVLAHQCDVAPQTLQGDGAHVVAVDAHRAARHVVEAKQQLDQRRLAGARRPGEGPGSRPARRGSSRL